MVGTNKRTCWRRPLQTGGVPRCLSAFYPSFWTGEYKVLSVIKNPDSMGKHSNFLFMSQSHMSCLGSGGWKLTQSFRYSSSKDFLSVAPASSWALESSNDSSASNGRD